MIFHYSLILLTMHIHCCVTTPLQGPKWSQRISSNDCHRHISTNIYFSKIITLLLRQTHFILQSEERTTAKTHTLLTHTQHFTHSLYVSQWSITVRTKLCKLSSNQWSVIYIKTYAQKNGQLFVLHTATTLCRKKLHILLRYITVYNFRIEK